MAESTSLLTSLLSPTLAARLTQQAEEDQIAQGSSGLVQQAMRTANMFSKQLSGLTGADQRSPAEQKLSRMQQLIQNAEGEDIYDKMENALPFLEQEDPALAIQIGQLVTERKTAIRGTQSTNALATYFAGQGRADLAEAVAGGTMTPAKAIEIMQKDREIAIQEGKEAKGKAVTMKQVQEAQPFYEVAISQDDTLKGIVNELADLDWTDYVIPFTSILGVKVSDDPATVKAQITALATERAEQIKLDNPKISRKEALVRALSDMKSGGYASSTADPFAGVN